MTKQPNSNAPPGFGNDDGHNRTGVRSDAHALTAKTHLMLPGNAQLRSSEPILRIAFTDHRITASHEFMLELAHVLEAERDLVAGSHRDGFARKRKVAHLGEDRSLGVGGSRGAGAGADHQ